MMRLRNTVGSVFILVMWTLLVMSIFSFSVGRTVWQHLHLLGALERKDRLRDIADAGIKQALDIIHAKPRDGLFFDALNQDWAVNEAAFKEIALGEGVYTVSYEDVQRGTVYGVVDEESKINLNKLNDGITLGRLLGAACGLNDSDARAVADTILDWQDADEDTRDKGAESDYYEKRHPSYRAKNNRLDALEELLWIKDVTPEMVEQLKPYVTLFGTGAININTASPVAFRALGFGNGLISKMISHRAGADQIAGTADDGVFMDLSTVVSDLEADGSLPPDERQSLEDFIGSGVLTVFSEHFTIKSMATLNTRPERLMAVATVKRYGRMVRAQEYNPGTVE